LKTTLIRFCWTETSEVMKYSLMMFFKYSVLTEFCISLVSFSDFSVFSVFSV